MHRCLHIAEVLYLIFEFLVLSGGDFRLSDECPRTIAGLIKAHYVARSREHAHWPHVGHRTLAGLARTCRLISSIALDVLWHELYSFYPILYLFPSPSDVPNDAQWLILAKYAKRVRTIHILEVDVPVTVPFNLRRCPEAYLPLLPNLVELEWSKYLLSTPKDHCALLLRYLASPSVTSMTLFFLNWPVYSPARLAVLADLPRLCPNITSLTIVPNFSGDHKETEEISRLVPEWPNLRHLETCALTQSAMDQLLSRQTLETLHIDYHSFSPKYTGRIPDVVHDISLYVETPLMRTAFFHGLSASPTTFCVTAMDKEYEDADFEQIFHLLPRCLDTSRLQSLTVQPRSITSDVRPWHRLKAQQSTVSELVQFTALCELDLDALSTAQLCDADYTHMAASLGHLQTLKLGTRSPSRMQATPAASIGAVVAVLTHCLHLHTLHTAFDGSIPPPGGVVLEDGKVGLSEEVIYRGWGVSNKRITEFCVGFSPITDASVDAISRCLKSIMPRLVRIKHVIRANRREWRVVEARLQSD